MDRKKAADILNQNAIGLAPFRQPAGILDRPAMGQLGTEETERACRSLTACLQGVNAKVKESIRAAACTWVCVGCIGT